MAKAVESKIADLVKAHEAEILRDWMRNQLSGERSRIGAISEESMREESMRFLRLFTAALDKVGVENMQDATWEEAQAMLGDLSRSRAIQAKRQSESSKILWPLSAQLIMRISGCGARDLVLDQRSRRQALFSPYELLRRILASIGEPAGETPPAIK